MLAMLMAAALLLTACKKDVPKNNEAKENTAQEDSKDSKDGTEGTQTEEDKKNDEYAELVKRTKGVSDLIEGDLVIQDVKVYKAVEEGDKLSLLVNYAEFGYKYNDHVFENTAGMLMPLKLVYVKSGDDYELKEKIDAEDGEGYYASLVKMADGDEERAKEVAVQGINTRYDSVMKELYKAAEKAGLKDFTLDIDNAPGYPKDESLFIEDVPNEPKNTIAIVNKEAYEKAKKNEANENWPHIDGLLYHKDTKIAVKNIIDDFTK